ncbi:hypothetical protein MBLNU459_g5136t1 [Dothideomycetes sp. NU459]
MADISDAAVQKKAPKQQLSKGMEHMRFAVTVPETTPSAPSVPAPQEAESTPEEEAQQTQQAQEEAVGEAAYGVPATFLPVRKPLTDAAQNEQKRSDPFQFGSRYLEEGDDIFAYNAWDHVETDDTYKAFIETQAEFQRSSPVSDFDKKRFNDHPEKWWDKFYSNNRTNFFKDRKWLVQEFPVLGEVTKAEHGPATLLEIGAGAGNTAFPVLAMNKNPHLRIHACDYSKKAIELIRQQEAYDGDVLHADVWDAAGQGEHALPPGVAKSSVDLVIMIFIFSALSPKQWAQCVRNVFDVLKPGGEVLFRDYGRGDLAQVRFKKGRYLEENFYIRGDGTRVYFFEEEELAHIWTGNLPPNAKDDAAGGEEVAVDDLAETLQDAKLTYQPADTSKTPAFEILNLGVDRRMLVNRQRKLKMYRCWMQGRFKKPQPAAPEAA